MQSQLSLHYLGLGEELSEFIYNDAQLQGYFIKSLLGFTKNGLATLHFASITLSGTDGCATLINDWDWEAAVRKCGTGAQIMLGEILETGIGDELARGASHWWEPRNPTHCATPCTAHMVGP